MQAKEIGDLLDVPGVYVFAYADEVLYVGESRHLRTRVREHCLDGRVFGVDGVRIAWLSTPDHKAVERHLIDLLRPRFNGKSPHHLYFWHRDLLGIPDSPDDPATAKLRAAVELLREIADD